MSSSYDGDQSMPAPLRYSPNTAEGGTIQLSPVAVSLSAAVLLVNGFISLRFKLGLHTQLVIASIRMVVQLSLLGYILVPIFTYDKWWLVLLYGMFMLIIASLEAVQRPSYTFQGILANTLLAMATSTALLLSYLVLVVLGLRPVWEAQYIIPLAGMLLGNATSAVSVGLSTVLEDLAANRAVIEHMLALGANRLEATDNAVRRALKVSMTPLLNQMSVMGIVSIPGMMTGQILAGGDPTQAARYQMVIIFIVVAATSLASVSSIYLAVLHVVDSTHTFRMDRLIKRHVKHVQGAGGRWAEWAAAARRGGLAVRRKGVALGGCLAAACCCCLCPAPARRRRVRGGSGGGGAAAPLLPNGNGNGSASVTVTARVVAALRRGLSWPPWLPWLRPTSGADGSRHERAAAAAAIAVHPGRRFSADSSTSIILGNGGGGTAAHGLGDGGGVPGITSPLSNSSVGAAGPSAGHAAVSWDDRMLGASYDSEDGVGGCGVGGPALGQGQDGGDDLTQQQQPLLGAAAAAQTRGGGSVTRGSSVLGSSVSAVVAMGGWLGSQASAGWGAAWNAVGWWRSPPARGGMGTVGGPAAPQDQSQGLGPSPQTDG